MNSWGQVPFSNNMQSPEASWEGMLLSRCSPGSGDKEWPSHWPVGPAEGADVPRPSGELKPLWLLGLAAAWSTPGLLLAAPAPRWKKVNLLKPHSAPCHQHAKDQEGLRACREARHPFPSQSPVPSPLVSGLSPPAASSGVGPAHITWSTESRERRMGAIYGPDLALPLPPPPSPRPSRIFSSQLWELSKGWVGENLHLSPSFGGRMSPGEDLAEKEKSQGSHGQTDPYCSSMLS